MVNNNQLLGVRELQAALNRVGNAPAKVLTKATKKEATMVRNKARQDSTYKTRAMRKGIKLKMEGRIRGKKVYQISFFGKDGKSGAEYIKISKAGKRSFYPVSQEYGWTSPNGTYHAGRRFLRGAYESNRHQIKQNMINTMITEINNVRA